MSGKTHGYKDIRWGPPRNRGFTNKKRVEISGKIAKILVSLPDSTSRTFGGSTRHWFSEVPSPRGRKLLFSIVCEECHVLMVQVLKKEEEFSSEALFFCPQCNHGITFHYVG